MEIELVEIRDFIKIRYPFSTLSEESANGLIPQIQIRYLRRGQPFPPELVEKELFYLIRSGAIELRDTGDQLMGHLAEGDFTAESCEFIKINPAENSIAIEDSLIYTLPCTVLRKLIREYDSFQQHFSDSVRSRLKLAASKINDAVDYNIARLTVQVSELIDKPPVILAETTSLQAAAQFMTDNRTSSLMLTDEKGVLSGLVTDHDFRKHCVAKGLDTQLPVKQIMPAKFRVIEHDSQILHAMMLMTRKNVHHLPVMKNNSVVGMLTAMDITHYSTSNPAFITSKIRKAKNLDELVAVLQGLPALQLSLADSSITARHIGEIISCVTDSLTKRLINLAQQDLGPAPVPFVWVAGGSQARLEQTSHSDQDNAMIISDDMAPEHDEYFKRLATIVSDGLDACGFVFCPGDAMATNKKWRQPVSIWKKYFDQWIHRPVPTALMQACIFFDLRVVYGKKKLYRELQRDMLHKAKKSKLFLAHMAANALTHKPPLGFFRKLVLIRGGEHDETFDIKIRGIAPITDIARVLALSEGIKAVNSTERLVSTRASRSLSKGMSDNLRDALEFIASLRIRHQANQIKRKQPVNNYLPPDQLSELERKHLKDAFAVIQDMQDSLKLQYNVGQLG